MSITIPAHLRDLLSRLEFLSMTEKGMKICMNDMTFTPAKSWAGALKRSRNGEGRRTLVIQLNTIVDETITMINKYEDTEFLPLIVNTFSRAKMGLNNLLSNIC